MDWLTTLVKDYYDKRVATQKALLLTGKHYFKRVFAFKEQRKNAFNSLASQDFRLSQTTEDDVHACIATKSGIEVKSGILALKTHISKLEDRHGFVIMSSALVAIIIAALKLMNLDDLIIYALASVPFIFIERARFLPRIHAMKELSMYLEHTLKCRKKRHG